MMGKHRDLTILSDHVTYLQLLENHFDDETCRGVKSVTPWLHRARLKMFACAIWFRGSLHATSYPTESVSEVEHCVFVYFDFSASTMATWPNCLFCTSLLWLLFLLSAAAYCPNMICCCGLVEDIPILIIINYLFKKTNKINHKY